ncbi:membrane protein [Bibersteinia trehalosi USDA-ARS-USMARC-188]|uniref:Membrane protein n=4 Tax=Bibersteinia trehalosi TaxID=47735 RepID=W0R5N3_BIBTR|nr:membrane protein [Bibersteinia trehalosi]AGH37618.1 membrane protein [Bibersteinia trehalosi USDA-ARS-USMARC-192]AHG82573.1 membrane protein [Bibersteinia trehalosi USDA-ARS-USMARC-188]AHG84907.1 membrane protein [Bibersteinia trehalosi USDA-ARS-USMARC-189]AHG85610.1 membrane protein [Bibersteinia trehalosi USDA-ARS-USMARC-190]RRN06301.1 hypothetical protein EIM44_00350 [Bibersteinia trehalosi]
MQNSPIQFSDSQKKTLYIVYGLFLASLLFGGLTAIVGVVLLYVKRHELVDYQDHYAYLFRTFWGAIVLYIVGIVLAFIGIGALVILASSIWFLFRTIYGGLKLHDNKGVTATGWFI